MNIFYRTFSRGGIDGRDLKIDNWVTEEAAREAALKDTWNSDYTLYRVQLIFESNGRITEKQTKIGDIPCGYELKWGGQTL